MTELDSLHGSLAAISPNPTPSATPAEKAAEMRATWQAYIDEANK